MSEVASFVVPQALAGERIDRAVALLTGFSRAQCQELIRNGEVLLDGAVPSKSTKLEVGTVVEISGAPPEVEPLIADSDVSFDVRFSDDDIVVVNKPAGVVVHPGAGTTHKTLVHGLLAMFPEIADVGDPLRPGIVHRLDKDTSGLLVVARRARAYDALVRMMSAHEIRRTYLAVVQGELEHSEIMIDAPIGRKMNRPTQMSVRAGGREARTKVSVLEYENDKSLVKCELETGRTHQIRVHLSAIGHPVVGDATYGHVYGNRPFLHAWKLEFCHPFTGAELSFVEPLPAELEVMLQDFGFSGPEQNPG